jgi:hypothetical protein
MVCQECKAAQATVRIAKRIRNPQTGVLERESTELHFCPICTGEYRAAHGLEGRSLGHGQPKATELVRVMSVTPEWTVYRLVRTDSDPVPEEWRLITDRVPARPVGTEMRITYTE